jgi:glycerophosphoryl diester phosphodiesterase
MFFRVAVVFILTNLLMSCHKNENYSQIDIIGHAAMGLSMPNSGFHSNSKEAIDFALTFPAITGVELDVRISKDGELWLYHDNYLESETNGFGCLENMLSQEIESLVYSSFHKEKLVQLSKISFDPNKKYFFDLKLINACDNKVVDMNLLKQRLLEINQSNISLILPSPSYFSLFGSEFYCLLSCESVSVLKNELDSQNWIGGVIRNSSISSQELQELKSSGKQIYLFDLRSPQGNLNALRKHPTGIFTDDVRSAQALAN